MLGSCQPRASCALRPPINASAVAHASVHHAGLAGAGVGLLSGKVATVVSPGTAPVEIGYPSRCVSEPSSWVNQASNRACASVSNSMLPSGLSAAPVGASGGLLGPLRRIELPCGLIFAPSKRCSIGE